MKTIYATIIILVMLLQTSCDPDVNIDYNLVNKTDEKLKVKIFGLRDRYQGLIQEYDTIIGQGEKINIYRIWFLGDSYINPADTITIFDSIQVVRNSIKAKSDFKKLETWDYSEKKYKYGGGHYIYELSIKNEDF